MSKNKTLPILSSSEYNTVKLLINESINRRESTYRWAIISAFGKNLKEGNLILKNFDTQTNEIKKAIKRFEELFLAQYDEENNGIKDWAKTTRNETNL